VKLIKSLKYSSKFYLKRILSTPNNKLWPNIKKCQLYKEENFPVFLGISFKEIFPNLSDSGIDLLSRLLSYDPFIRINSFEAFKHDFFN
jgi:serine/threonine protein kinase